MLPKQHNLDNIQKKNKIKKIKFLSLGLDNSKLKLLWRDLYLHLTNILSISIPIVPIVKLSKSRNSLTPVLTYRFIFKSRRMKHNYNFILNNYKLNNSNLDKHLKNLFIC